MLHDESGVCRDCGQSVMDSRGEGGLYLVCGCARRTLSQTIDDLPPAWTADSWLLWMVASYRLEIIKAWAGP